MAFGSAIVVTATCGWIVTEPPIVTAIPPLSATRTLKVFVPDDVGVPVIVQPAFRVSPVWSVPPTSEQVYGSRPSRGVHVLEYGMPTSPPTEAHVAPSGPRLTTICIGRCAVLPVAS